MKRIAHRIFTEEFKKKLWRVQLVVATHASSLSAGVESSRFSVGADLTAKQLYLNQLAKTLRDLFLLGNIDVITDSRFHLCRAAMGFEGYTNTR